MFPTPPNWIYESGLFHLTPMYRMLRLIHWPNPTSYYYYDDSYFHFGTTHVSMLVHRHPSWWNFVPADVLRQYRSDCDWDDDELRTMMVILYYPSWVPHRRSSCNSIHCQIHHRTSYYHPNTEMKRLFDQSWTPRHHLRPCWSLLCHRVSHLTAYYNIKSYSWTRRFLWFDRAGLEAVVPSLLFLVQHNCSFCWGKVLKKECSWHHGSNFFVSDSNWQSFPWHLQANSNETVLKMHPMIDNHLLHQKITLSVMKRC